MERNPHIHSQFPGLILSIPLSGAIQSVSQSPPKTKKGFLSWLVRETQWERDIILANKTRQHNHRCCCSFLNVTTPPPSTEEAPPPSRRLSKPITYYTQGGGGKIRTGGECSCNGRFKHKRRPPLDVVRLRTSWRRISNLILFACCCCSSSRHAFRFAAVFTILVHT